MRSHPGDFGLGEATNGDGQMSSLPDYGRRYVEAIQQSRFAVWVLAAIAFADSSFLPVPPDFLLIPLVLLRREQIWSLSIVCVVASSLGAMVGYAIGYGLWSLIGSRLVELYGFTEGFATYRALVEEWGACIIIAKAFTPVPFKITAIAAGVAAMNPVVFIIATVIGRALHFAMIVGLVRLLGGRFRTLIASYDRPLAVISLLVLVGLAIAYYLR
jgi:membrane protein YqaA with SNARE-associated domain